MTTETQSENTSSTDNKAIFAPLGKYAVIAVIIVSIIVTTAIMLDKQLNTVDQQIAEIEADITKTKREDTKIAGTTTATETKTNAVAASATIKASNADVTIDNTALISSTEPGTVATSVEIPSAEVLIATETENIQVAVASTHNNTELATDSTNSVSEEATFSNSIGEKSIDETMQMSFAVSGQHNVDVEKNRRAHIDSFKLEQKKRMTDMFARIRALEAQQLDQYKTNQSDQVSRLRGQIAQQEQMIETLVLRNQDLFEMRAANVQRVQSHREDILNRI